MHFINNAFGKTIFHSKLSFKTSVLHQFPTSYANMQLWKRKFSHISYTASFIGSQFLCFNNYITIDNNSVHLRNFRVTVSILSRCYLLLRENLKTGITSKENFNSPITYITNLHKFYKQFRKS